MSRDVKSNAFSVRANANVAIDVNLHGVRILPRIPVRVKSCVAAWWLNVNSADVFASIERPRQEPHDRVTPQNARVQRDLHSVGLFA